MIRKLFPVLIGAVWLLIASPVGATEIVDTSHSIVVKGQTLDYTASAGLLTVPDPRSGATADFFFAAYRLAGGDASRPLTFVFNGGPGASAAYLHLLAAGPYRISLPDDGSLPEPPATLVVNEDTWLTFTDLVFIDPVGTGFSRCTDCMGQGYRPYWGVLQDRNTVAEFIIAYLDYSGRWSSPKYMLGESYGGIRAPLLLNYLPSHGRPVTFEGGMLLSPAVDLGAAGSNGDKYNLRPHAMVVPAYARVAAYHGLAPAAEGKTEAQFRAEAEAFAMGDYLSAIAQGSALDATTRAAVFGKMSDFIGLPVSLIDSLNGRVEMLVFSKELLKDRGLLTGWFDGTITGPDPDPDSAEATIDYSSDRITSLIDSAVIGYLADQLGFSTSYDYLTLNVDAEPNWDWTYPPTAGGDGQGWTSVGDELAEAMTNDPTLKVAVYGGSFDTVIPYYGSRYLINHLGLTGDIAANISLTVYEGGHMVYSHKDARQSFTADLKAFYNGE